MVDHGSLIVMIMFNWLGIKLSRLRKAIYISDQAQLVGLRVEPVDEGSLILLFKLGRLNFSVEYGD